MPSSSSSAAPDVLLQLRHVSKIYGELHAVDDVSLEVPRGQWLSLVGSSGSGKTTLMNIIGCMDTATRGSVLLDGRELGRLNAAQLTEIRKNVIGLVFQQFHLIPHLTAVENVMVAQYYHSMTDEKEALEALGDVGLGERAHHLPSQLSGGEQQRVCIARALINHPEIVLADEPTGNLDEANEQLVLDIFARLHEAGTTLIVVTHDAHVASCGQRQILLNHGRLGVTSFPAAQPVRTPVEQAAWEAMSSMASLKASEVFDAPARAVTWASSTLRPTTAPEISLTKPCM